MNGQIAGQKGRRIARWIGKQLDSERQKKEGEKNKEEEEDDEGEGNKGIRGGRG